MFFVGLHSRNFSLFTAFSLALVDFFEHLPFQFVDHQVSDMTSSLWYILIDQIKRDLPSKLQVGVRVSGAAKPFPNF